MALLSQVEWPASPPEHRFTLERVRGDKATVYVTTTFSKGRFTLPKIKEVFMKVGAVYGLCSVIFLRVRQQRLCLQYLLAMNALPCMHAAMCAHARCA